MATVVPGGAYLDDKGRPQDANGDRIGGLPGHLREEEKVTCRDAGLIAQKQVDYYSAEELGDRFGLTAEFARFVKGELSEEEYRPDEIDATDAAKELAEEAGIGLPEVDGTGKDGRVTKGDVKDAMSDDA